MDITLPGTGRPIRHPERLGAANPGRLNDGYILFDAGRAATARVARIKRQSRNCHRGAIGLSQLRAI